ncbi:MAG: hypothetical protein OMM_11915 [Candidatus Magnetoglobus multicellularis str. Araruama]|uniref:Permease n=1 Tax=Candidatus Magnetoglobus multicellularis str. Araruama TaxID=890399 RepID=A0A1V1NXB2_9BACT|nr:MAG: hypothetical protein OMM_11915 [Candidatus Magnetoglobus multicellularis str. Araruama]
MIAWKRFIKILPAFVQMLIIVSVILYFIPPDVITKYLGPGNKWIGVFTGSLLGAISLMPGFIAYPLAGILLKEGVSYMAIASFVTTLMMVGILTYPVEKKYFGAKVTIFRNLLGFINAIFIALIIGLLYGELI